MKQNDSKTIGNHLSMDFSAPNLTLSKKTADTTMYSCALQRVVRLGSEGSSIKDICQLATSVSMPGNAGGGDDLLGRYSQRSR